MTTYKNPRALLAGLTLGLFLSGCVTLQENIGKAVGTTVGAGLGLVGCQELGGSDAECAAAAVAGGVVGYSLGKLYDKRRQRLASAAAETDADIEFESVKVSSVVTASGTQSRQGSAMSTQSEGLVVSVRQGEMFVVGSSSPTESAINTFSRLAEVYAEQFAFDDGTEVDTQLLIVGHADATGGAVRNQLLSERRATAIAAIFNKSGIPASRLYVSGAGSSQPVADNETAFGRQQNRRVEILEISDEEGLVSFSDIRKSDPRFLKHSTRDPGQAVAQVDRSDEGDATAATEADRKSSALIDFAGTPANESDTSVLMAIGSVDQGSGLSSRLVATDSGYEVAESRQPSVPCVADSPRVSGSVVSFDSKQDVSARYATDDFMPGMNQRAWQSSINGHLVSVSPVSVLQPNGQPASSPIVFIYGDYKGASDEPTSKVETLVETYMSSKGVLYRVYSLEAGTAFYCADLALPLSEPSVAMGGKLYYREGAALYEQNYKPSAISVQ